MASEEQLAFLQTVPMFAGMERDELVRLAAQIVYEALPERRVLEQGLVE
jgi:hypothetical protein